MKKKSFGTAPNGQKACIYEIRWGEMSAWISDFGATLVRLYVPDSQGNVADVVLGYDSPRDYVKKGGYFGATVGRNANRVAGGKFTIGDKTVQMPANENGNNLHSGPDSYAYRLWTVEKHTENSIRFSLESPDGDQGMPGNAKIHVTYTLDHPGALHLTYDAISDQDTVFNLTNHAYFNMAGHDHPEKAMDQVLMLTARHYLPDDEQSIPLGENKSVEGTPMDFRQPKPIGRDIDQDYRCLKLQGGYDHCFEAFADPCAILTDPQSGRSMSVSTDCPGLQFYSGNFLSGEKGKDGVSYCYRGGVALETQFYPNSVNNPKWVQPFFKAGQRYHSETVYSFKW
ncbi:MAG: galactose mutarotase [Oscillospiraceae bacterium]|nr:galactose mutarotase [Oscillospiraceae bacterium]